MFKNKNRGQGQTSRTLTGRRGYFTARVLAGYCKDCGNRRTLHAWRCEACQGKYRKYMSERRARERAERKRRAALTPTPTPTTWGGRGDRRGETQVARAKVFARLVERTAKAGEDVVERVRRGRALSRRGGV